MKWVSNGCGGWYSKAGDAELRVTLTSAGYAWHAQTRDVSAHGRRVYRTAAAAKRACALVARRLVADAEHRIASLGAASA